MKIRSYSEFKADKLHEQELFEAKGPSTDFGFGAKKLTDLKVGDFVWRQMQRYNPQLGTYYTMEKYKVGKITGKKIFTADKYGDDMKSYDRETGEESKNSQAAYGSAWYSLMTHQEALGDLKAYPEKYKRGEDKIKNLKLEDIKEFMNESVDYNLYESEVNYQTDEFALVRVGGSIGSKNSYPVYAAGKMGTVIETSNDKEDLKAKAKSMRKSLSAGERSYYGMNYTVIALTNSKRKEIEYLLDFQKKSEADKVEESQLFEGIGTIALGIMVAYIGIKAIGYIGRKILGAIGENVTIEPEKLKEIIQEITLEAASKTGAKLNLIQAAVLIKILEDKIDSGEITNIKGIRKYLQSYAEEELNEGNYTYEDEVKLAIFEEMIFENEATINKFKSSLEKSLNVKLVDIYNSIKDKNPDEEFGHYITYEIRDNSKNPVESYGEYLVLNVYEDGTAQFFFDATPYPISTNSKDDEALMVRFLQPVPRPVKEFTAKELGIVISKMDESIFISESTSYTENMSKDELKLYHVYAKMIDVTDKDAINSHEKLDKVLDEDPDTKNYRTLKKALHWIVTYQIEMER